jgi:hypothetical protein
LKNPFLSFWLSAANRMFATSRAYANVELKRQARSAQTALRKAATPAVAPTRKRKPRKAKA